MAGIDYERLLKAKPDSFNGRLGLSTLEQKEGKYDAALAILNSMLSNKDEVSTSQLAVLYVARAGVEKELKQVDIALLDLEKAISLDAAQMEAYLVRGEIYLSQKKKNLAKRDFEKAVSLGAPQADLRALLQQCK